MFNRYLVRFAASALLAGGLFAATGAAPAGATAEDEALVLFNDNGDSREVIAREGCVALDAPYSATGIRNLTNSRAEPFESGDCTGTHLAVLYPGQEAQGPVPLEVGSVGFTDEF